MAGLWDAWLIDRGNRSPVPTRPKPTRGVVAATPLATAVTLGAVTPAGNIRGTRCVVDPLPVAVCD